MLRIRLARGDERNELIDLQRRASLAVAEYREALLAHPDAIDLPLAQIRARQVRVATIEHSRIGFSAVIPRDGCCELDGLFVEPAQWRQGVGRALVEDAMNRAVRSGTDVMEVTANPAAQEFYQRLGFVTCGVVETRFGPAPRMRRAMPVR